MITKEFTQSKTIIVLSNIANPPISQAKANQLKETMTLREVSTGASIGRKEVRDGCQIKILISQFVRLPITLKS